MILFPFPDSLNAMDEAKDTQCFFLFLFLVRYCCLCSDGSSNMASAFCHHTRCFACGRKVFNFSGAATNFISLLSQIKNNIWLLKIFFLVCICFCLIFLLKYMQLCIHTREKNLQTYVYTLALVQFYILKGKQHSTILYNCTFKKM